MAKMKHEVELGNPKCFAIQTRNGMAEAIRAEITLSKNDKDFCIIYGRPCITAKGYAKLNQVAGISILSPQMIGDKANPIIEYEDGSPSRVTTRKIGVGYSPIGSLCVIDETVNFDMNSYLRQQAFKKWQEFQNIGKLVSKPKGDLENKTFIPLIGSNGLLLDMYHEESQKLISDHLGRQKFAARIASAIARRNCLKAHPAIATTTCKIKDGVASVIVYGFKIDFSRSDIERIAENAADGKAADNVELIQHQTNADSEDLSVENDVTDPEHDDMEPNADVDTDQDSEPEVSTLEKIINYRKVIGPKKHDEIVPEDIFDKSEKEQQEVLNRIGKEILRRAKP